MLLPSKLLVRLGCGRQIDTVSIGDEAAIPNANGEQAKLDLLVAFVVTKGS